MSGLNWNKSRIIYFFLLLLHSVLHLNSFVFTIFFVSFYRICLMSYMLLFVRQVCDSVAFIATEPKQTSILLVSVFYFLSVLLVLNWIVKRFSQSNDWNFNGVSRGIFQWHPCDLCLILWLFFFLFLLVVLLKSFFFRFNSVTQPGTQDCDW